MAEVEEYETFTPLPQEVLHFQLYSEVNFKQPASLPPSDLDVASLATISDDKEYNRFSRHREEVLLLALLW
jgi:hypothetical protein